MRFLFIISLLCSFHTFAADPSKPHPHKGSLPHYDGAPPDPEAHLTTDQKQTLASGKPIYTSVQSEGGGGAVAIFKVSAPSKTIWRVINNFPKYPGWIEGGYLEKLNVYKREGDKIFVQFDLNLGWLGGRWTYYVEHYYPAGKGWGTWKLDYSRNSDLDDSVGFWRVREISNLESVVTYSVNISVSNVPAAVSNLIGSSSVGDAIKWVKEQSEALAGK